VSSGVAATLARDRQTFTRPESTREQMSKDYITVRGAAEHNLKDLDVSIPREQFNVVTGLSGSGKSSLAFQTVYAEGQRRYI